MVGRIRTNGCRWRSSSLFNRATALSPERGPRITTTSKCAQRLTSVLRVAPRPSRPPWCVARGREDASQAALCHSRKWECNSVCARGLLLKSLSSLLYILSGEPIIEKVFSYWIYFLARLPTTSGPVGWGLCGCDAACTLAPADAWSAPRHSSRARAGKADNQHIHSHSAMAQAYRLVAQRHGTVSRAPCVCWTRPPHPVC